MKILITGGLGYIGSKLALALEQKGYEVESFDLPKDIRNAEELKKAIKGKDAVYHLAALAELSYTDAHPQETYEVNIVGTNGEQLTRIASKAVNSNTSELLWFTPETLGAIAYFKAVATINDGGAAAGTFDVKSLVQY